MKRKTYNCLVPKCNTGTLARRLCPTHYRIAAKLVEMGRTTWSELEAKGKAAKKKATKEEGTITAWFLE